MIVWPDAVGPHQHRPRRSAAKVFGAAITEVGGGKQVAGIGAPLDQPVVVQVNDAQGSPVAGALG